METALLVLFRTLTVAIVVLLVALAAVMYRAGRTIATNRRPDGSHDPKLIKRHRSVGKCMGVLFALLIPMILLQMALGPAPAVSGWLRDVHDGLAATGALLAAAIWTRFTGVRYPRTHRVLAHLVGAEFALLVLTGLVRLYRLPF